MRQVVVVVVNSFEIVLRVYRDGTEHTALFYSRQNPFPTDFNDNTRLSDKNAQTIK